MLLHYVKRANKIFKELLTCSTRAIFTTSMSHPPLVRRQGGICPQSNAGVAMHSSSACAHVSQATFSHLRTVKNFPKRASNIMTVRAKLVSMAKRRRDAFLDYRLTRRLVSISILRRTPRRVKSCPPSSLVVDASDKRSRKWASRVMSSFDEGRVSRASQKRDRFSWRLATMSSKMSSRTRLRSAEKIWFSCKTACYSLSSTPRVSDQTRRLSSTSRWPPLEINRLMA